MEMFLRYLRALRLQAFEASATFASSDIITSNGMALGMAQAGDNADTTEIAIESRESGLSQWQERSHTLKMVMYWHGSVNRFGIVLL